MRTKIIANLKVQWTAQSKSKYFEGFMVYKKCEYYKHSVKISCMYGHWF